MLCLYWNTCAARPHCRIALMAPTILSWAGIARADAVVDWNDITAQAYTAFSTPLLPLTLDVRHGRGHRLRHGPCRHARRRAGD